MEHSLSDWAQRQGDLWGGAARDWADYQEPMYLPLWSAMLNAAGVGPDTLVLDAGCGAGGAAALAASRGARVSGVDAAAPMLAVARERLPGGDFRLGELDALPFPGSAFAAVISCNSMQYAKEKVHGLRELGRVCHPGGIVVAAVWGQEPHCDYRVVVDAVRSTLPQPPGGGGPFALAAPGVLEGLFAEAGLPVTGSGEVDCPSQYPDLETGWRSAAAGITVQQALRQVPADKVRTAVLQALRDLSDAKGVVKMNNRFKYVWARVRGRSTGDRA